MRILRNGVGLGICGDQLAFVSGLSRADDATVVGDGPDVRPDFHHMDEAVSDFGLVGVLADSCPGHFVPSFVLTAVPTDYTAVPTAQVGNAKNFQKTTEQH